MHQYCTVSWVDIGGGSIMESTGFRTASSAEEAAMMARTKCSKEGRVTDVFVSRAPAMAREPLVGHCKLEMIIHHVAPYEDMEYHGRAALTLPGHGALVVNRFTIHSPAVEHAIKHFAQIGRESGNVIVRSVWAYDGRNNLVAMATYV